MTSSTLRFATPCATARADGMSTVNRSARQRMLSQRLALQILLAERGVPGQLEAAEASLQLFADSQVQLQDEVRSALGEDAKQLEAVYGSQGVGQTVQGFVDRCRRALTQLRRGDASSVDQVYEGLDDVLQALNLATSAFDAIAARREQHLMRELRGIVTDIQQVAREAKIVSFNAQVIAARAGHAGREFGVVAGRLSDVSGDVGQLARKGLDLVSRK